MAALADADLKGLRDRAILLLGFAGAFRRSELVALDVGDLEFCESGMRVHIRRSKTDQEGAGHTIAIVPGSVACPVRAVRAWLEASKITAGPLFRPIGKGGRIGTERLADHTVVRVVKASARRVGLDPKLFAGHSLRSGFLKFHCGDLFEARPQPFELAPPHRAFFVDAGAALRQHVKLLLLSQQLDCGVTSPSGCAAIRRLARRAA
jgi:integrase